MQLVFKRQQKLCINYKNTLCTTQLHHQNNKHNNRVCYSPGYEHTAQRCAIMTDKCGSVDTQDHKLGVCTYPQQNNSAKNYANICSWKWRLTYL